MARAWTLGMRRLLPLYVVPLFLVSCSGCPDDPAQAGFFCGVRNITTGTYERRQAALSHEAKLAEGYGQAQQARLQTLQQEEAGLQSERARLQKSLASVQRDLKREQTLIAKAKENPNADQQRLKRLEIQRTTLEDELRDRLHSNSVTRRQIEDLQQNIAELDGKIEDAASNRAAE